jgi:hypothetical protein
VSLSCSLANRSGQLRSQCSSGKSLGLEPLRNASRTSAACRSLRWHQGAAGMPWGSPSPASSRPRSHSPTPQVVVVGGQWGRDDAFLAQLSRQDAELPRPVPVVAAAVGERPQLVGARAAALDRLRDLVVAGVREPTSL